MPTNRKAGVTRRDFIQVSSGVLAAGLASGNGPDTTLAGNNTDAGEATTPLPIKIALEEHFDFSATENASYAARGSSEFQRQIKDLGAGRIAEMDRGGVEVCILSLVGPGIQAIPNVRQAVEVARQANDHLAENIAKNPKRLKGFAALALQDPEAAAHELTRCMRDLHFCGALVNGFTETGEAGSVTFYDLP